MVIIAVIVAMTVLASCKAKKKVVQESKAADSLQVMEVSMMQRTASDTSSTWAIQQLFKSLKIDIDSIVITRETEGGTVCPGESLAYGTALSAVTHHDHLRMAMECYGADNSLGEEEAAAALKTASIPRPPPASSSPYKATANNKAKERIVIAGLRFNQDNTATVASVTESKDTVTEAVADVVRKAEVSTQEHKSVEKREPASAPGLKILLMLAGIITLIYIFRKKV